MVARKERETTAALASLLQLGQDRFTLAFVYYDQPAYRNWVVMQLRLTLPSWRFAIVSLQDTRIDLRNLSGRFFESLQEIAQHDAKGQPYDAVLLLDWEQRLDPNKSLAEQPDTALVSVFNMGRDLLEQSFNCPVLILLPQDAMGTVMRLAPDLVSWQSGSFHIPFDAVAFESDLHAVLAAPPLAQNGELATTAEHIEMWLDVAQKLENPSSDLLAQALAALGDLYIAQGEASKAASHFKRLAQWGTEHQHRQWRRYAKQRQHQVKHLAPPPPEPTLQMQKPWEILRGAASLTDSDPIFGREEDVRQVLRMIVKQDFRFGVLCGETGCGKTSLVQAGILPSLRRQGYLPVYLNQYADPEGGMARAIAVVAGIEPATNTLEDVLRAVAKTTDKHMIILCDQFERVFVGNRRSRRPFLSRLSACIHDLGLPVKYLLLMRADHLYHLSEFDDLTALHSPFSLLNRYELRWLRQPDAKRALVQLGEAIQGNWPEDLTEAVIQDLSSEDQVKPVEIQLMAAALYLRGVRTLEAYEESGGVKGLLQDYLNAVFDTLSQPLLARQVVRNLVTPTTPPMRALKSPEELAREIRAPEKEVERLLEELKEPHVVELREATSPNQYELVHDVLVEPAHQATTPQEMGLSLIRSALAKGQRYLRRSNYRMAMRSDMAELPERQQLPARQLLRRSFWKFRGMEATVVLIPLLILITFVQFTTAHVRLDPESRTTVQDKKSK